MWPRDLAIEMKGKGRFACLTVWKYTDKPDCVPFDDELIRYAVWQREKCPETGKLHLQMYAEATKQLTIRQWKTAVGDETAHVESRRGSREEAIAYCKKEESRDEETYHEFGRLVSQGHRKDVEEKEKRIAVTLSAMLQYRTIKGFLRSEEYEDYAVFYNMNEELLNKMFVKERTREAHKRKAAWWDDKPLFTWQKEVVELCESPPDDRHMLWLWSDEGDRGKSKISEYLRTFHDAIEIGGKGDNCRFAFNHEPIVIFDISASQQDYVSGLYGVAEQLKNGACFSGKYMSCEKDFIPPHVLFISNMPPPTDAWKQNRIIELRVPSDNRARCIKKVL